MCICRSMETWSCSSMVDDWCWFPLPKELFGQPFQSRKIPLSTLINVQFWLQMSRDDLECSNNTLMSQPYTHQSSRPNVGNNHYNNMPVSKAIQSKNTMSILTNDSGFWGAGDQSMARIQRPYSPLWVTSVTIVSLSSTASNIWSIFATICTSLCQYVNGSASDCSLAKSLNCVFVRFCPRPMVSSSCILRWRLKDKHKHRSFFIQTKLISHLK